VTAELRELQQLTEVERPITYGVVKPGAEDSEKGVLFVRGGDIVDGKIDTTVLRTITQEVSAPYARTILRGGEVVISLVGNPGAVAVVPDSLSGANLARQVGLIALKREHYAPYIKYYLMSPKGKAELFQRTQGAVQQVINLADLKKIKVRVPPICEQQRIADVLSAYDDLIENNRRRIKLLEESARLLYREWFVHLRFPGHEHVKIVDGVPDGWRKRSMSEVCIAGDGIQTGPFGSQLHQYEYAEIGVPVVMPKDLTDFRIDTSTIARVPAEVANRLARHRMVEGDVVYGRRGDIGRRAYINMEQIGFVCGTGCLRLRANPAVIAPRFFFDALGSPETHGLIIGRAKGSTMPNLNAGVLADIPILVPTASMQNEYVEFIKDTSAQVSNLIQQIEKLRQARNLLLPRLMSGDLRIA
jgi:type I restriction enzyme S subunit